MQLHDYISQLLKNHNCVIVPNFGGFIANYEPANVNRSAYVIYPPRKQVLFNGNLTQNDGLLANELALKESLTYVNALAKIEANVSEWRKKLAAGERIEIDEIGFLFSQNNQLIFEQNRETNLLLQAYGLKQISFVDFSLKAEVLHQKPLEVVSKKLVAVKDSVESNSKKKITPVITLDTNSEIEEIALEKETQIISLPEKNKKSNRYKYMAAAAVLPILFYSYWIPMRTDFLDTGKIQFSDFNPLRTQSKRTYSNRDSAFVYEQNSDWKSWEELTSNLPADVMVYNYELNEETYVPVDLNKEIASDQNDISANKGSFHLIGGCFSVEKNADNFVSDLSSKGYKASIVDKKNGLHRVSAGAYQTEQDAETALDSFKNNGFSGWILKK